MPWEVCSAVSQREEFIRFTSQAEVSLSELCRRFGVSRTTGYKWLARSQLDLEMTDRSRKPHTSPKRTEPEIEALICALRRKHPAWGGRKLHHFLRRKGQTPLPAPSTITRILQREGLLDPNRRQHRDWQRFEAAAPNHLWQMDFKGPLRTGDGDRFALTVLDDHSRFNLCLAICPDQTRETVQTQLERVFRTYGLPDCILSDNGPPWGSHIDGMRRFTRLAAWLMRQQIIVSHGRPAHPQTQGKDERFHGTYNRELLALHVVWPEAERLVVESDAWRDLYNWERPHEAIANEPPSTRYVPSSRPYLESPGPFEYPTGDQIRKVVEGGIISFHGRTYRVGRAFTGEPVALRAAGDGEWDVYYHLQRIRRLDLRTSASDL